MLTIKNIPCIHLLLKGNVFRIFFQIKKHTNTSNRLNFSMVFNNNFFLNSADVRSPSWINIWKENDKNIIIIVHILLYIHCIWTWWSMLSTLVPAPPSRPVADIEWTHATVPLYFFHSVKAGHPRMQNGELYPPRFQH